MYYPPRQKSSPLLFVLIVCAIVVYLGWPYLKQGYGNLTSPDASKPIKIQFVAASPGANTVHAQTVQVHNRAYYESVARQAALKAGINPDVFVRQVEQESGFRPTVRSSAGAIGIAQFMPDTAKGLGIDPLNPEQALYGAASLMARYVARYGNDYAKALAAYNAGTDRLNAALAHGGACWFWLLPNETQQYIQIILNTKWPSCQ